MRIFRKKTWILLCFLFIMFSATTSAEASYSSTAPKLSVQALFTSAKLSWTKRADLTGMEIYQTNSSGENRKLVQTVKKNRCFVTGLTPGKTYYYVIRGYVTSQTKTKYTKYSSVQKVKMPKNKQNSTIKNLLLTALKPVGSTMYIWGGGWNAADNGAGKEARTLGVSKNWKKFYQKQTSSYNYSRYLYQISKGLDCSGYVGWVIYNTFETTNNRKGYVCYASQMAKNYANHGWGSYTAKSKVKTHQAGDIMSSSGHVYIVVGSCADGSIVLLHSDPPGVFLCGTTTKSGNTNSQAIKLARKYMKIYYPDWYKKYPKCSRDSSYLTSYSRMRWDVSGQSVMSDPDGYTNMTAQEILNDLFR